MALAIIPERKVKRKGKGIHSNDVDLAPQKTIELSDTEAPDTTNPIEEISVIQYSLE